MAVKKPFSEKNLNKKSLKNPKSSSTEQNGAHQAGIAESGSMTEFEIRRRAYELFEARGCQHGYDWDDWIRAEAEVMSRHKEGI